MSFNLANIKWGWVGVGVAIAFVIAYASSICVVASYATYLAFQARGAPDQTMINEFAANTAEGIASILIGVGTLVGGFLAGRRAKADRLQNGLAVGLITAIIGLVFSLFRKLHGWLDRRLAAPVMHEKINSASDQFFEEEEKHWGESEIDSLVRGKFGDV